jgi:hypothetical protein
MLNGIFRSLNRFNYRVWAAGAIVSNTGTWMQRIAQDADRFGPRWALGAAALAAAIAGARHVAQVHQEQAGRFMAISPAKSHHCQMTSPPPQPAPD